MTADDRTRTAHGATPKQGALVRWSLALAALILLLTAHAVPGSWSDASRLATIESLVERGTLAIDDSTYFWQGDKVRFGEHYFSHQPPMLALIGALPYAFLHHLFGLEIDSGPTYRVLVWVLVGLPVWLGLAALARLCRSAGASDRTTALALLAALVATPLLPWSTVLNQHGAAAGLVLLAFAAIDRRRFATAGTLMALASTIDLTAMFPSLAGLLPVLRLGRLAGLARYASGALPPLALHLSINWRVAGDLVPFGMHDEAFEYPMSPFLLMSLTGVEQATFSAERAAYIFGASFGASGIFSHHPLLLLATAAGLALPWLRRAEQTGPAPGLLPAVGLSALGIAGYYLLESNNFGGSAFGMRWFTVFAPSLLLFPVVLSVRRPALFARPGVRAALLAASLWSTAGAALGTVNPWAKFHYRWVDSPTGRVAAPDDPRPTTLQHWRAEWQRIQRREPVTRDWYDQTYARMLDQHRKLYLGPTPWLDDEGRRAWVMEGLERLHRVVDLLDRDRTPVYSRVMGHFWLGKFYVECGDEIAAEREFEAALGLEPGHGPSTNSLARLREGRVNGGR